jgi:hypothetical protein
MFIQSFDMQIRRILISSNNDTSARRTRSRYPKIQAAINDQFKRYKRSNSVEQTTTTKDEHTTTDEGYRSNSSAIKKQNNYRKQRASSVVCISYKISETPSIIYFRRKAETPHNTSHVNEHYQQMMIRYIIHLFIQFKQKEGHSHHLRLRPHCPKNQRIFRFHQLH